MKKLNLSLMVDSENETKEILLEMLMNYDNLYIYKVKKQENVINTETKEIINGRYRIDFSVKKEEIEDANKIIMDGRPTNVLEPLIEENYENI
ncbi:hypothetical protein [Anaerofustis sp.]|uniref:hypothetical protein n=1 Tax=Anaerofustis sp. TaxID=1872517 RepID=UPI0025B9E735|nr:hypothetical protein [Anaerofustis sp.]